MSIQEKNGIYYVVVYYRDDMEKKRNKWIKVGPSIKEAEKKERSLRADIDRGDATFADKITVEKYLKQWLDTVVKPSNRNSTYNNYLVQINNISKTIGKIELAKLRAPQIQAHYNSELRRGLKPTSVRLQHSVLKMALEKAVEWQLITKNPCKYTEPPQKNKPKNAAYVPEHVEIMLEISKDTEMEIPITLGFLCGLRRGEICGLRWSDVFLDDNYAWIRHSLDRMGKKEAERLFEKGDVVWFGADSNKKSTVLALGPVKTEESASDIPLPAMVVQTLRRELERQETNKSSFSITYKDTGFVWCWSDGRPHDPDYLYNAFKKAIASYNKKIDEDKDIPDDEKDAAKLPDIRPHDMRHTAATLLMESGIDTKIVSRSLRHSRASFTGDYYQHVRRKTSMISADAMDDRFGDTKKPEK